MVNNNVYVKIYRQLIDFYGNNYYSICEEIEGLNFPSKTLKELWNILKERYNRSKYNYYIFLPKDNVIFVHDDRKVEFLHPLDDNEVNEFLSFFEPKKDD